MVNDSRLMVNDLLKFLGSQDLRNERAEVKARLMLQRMLNSKKERNNGLP